MYTNDLLWDADPGVCCAAFQLGACAHTESFDEHDEDPTPAQDVCGNCGYNVPHHAFGCVADPAGKAETFCPAHAPSGRALASDDLRLRCSTCGVNGYHVKRFASADEPF